MGRGYRHFHAEVNRHVKRCSTLSGKCKSSPEWDFYLSSVRMSILKREEISFDLKEKVLKKYKDIDYVIDQINWDLMNELYNVGITLDHTYVSDQDMTDYPELIDEKRALETLKNYQKEKQKGICRKEARKAPPSPGSAKQSLHAGHDPKSRPRLHDH